LVCERSSVAIKNGNKDGKTEEYHSAIPFLAALKLLLENINKNIVKMHMQKGIIADLTLKTINLKLFIYKLLAIKYISKRSKYDFKF
jgi:hypothetical protein